MTLERHLIILLNFLSLLNVVLYQELSAILDRVWAHVTSGVYHACSQSTIKITEWVKQETALIRSRLKQTYGV